MRTRFPRLVPLVALAALGCVGPGAGSCPRPGLDLSRRCKRLCVLGYEKGGSAPLPCHCVADCMCWRMPGHSARPPEE